MKWIEIEANDFNDCGSNEAFICAMMMSILVKQKRDTNNNNNNRSCYIILN